MTAVAHAERYKVEERARRSLGISNAAIYNMVVSALNGRHGSGGVLVDMGCGEGNLWRYVGHRFERYIGIDIARYEGFPTGAEFGLVNLDTGGAPLPDGCADVVASVETIEHLENPRAFMRELVRLARPRGWVIVTTPNQLSLLSLLNLVVKHQFGAFQDVDYPAHITALLEVDLMRIAAECGLGEVCIIYSLHGRIVITPWHYPKFLPRLLPRSLSDNLLLIGRKQGE